MSSGPAKAATRISRVEWSWITTVLVCLIAAILFAVSGYTGYTFTLLAVVP